MYNSQHTFHIPVMGLAYTVDSPIKVAKYGISSVISIVEDNLIEMMRRYYYPTINKVYEPISQQVEDYRAKRITDYLNLVNEIVQEQVEKLKQSAFETGSEIVKYFEMLPDDSMAKQLFKQLEASSNILERVNIEEKLRNFVQAGGIDVNIMTKLDSNKFRKDGTVIEDGSEAVSALRGYANSNLSNSSIVFSAGMNPRLYNYIERCSQFDADENGNFQKKIIIKVSDYRSALIQGKYLAKKGIWVSEFRIESGLNCGGHAFASDGFLMGPILEEFKNKKEELVNSIFSIYNQALKSKGKEGFNAPHPVKITAQGGIGTYMEDTFLRNYYGLDRTGWGSPFLLVPEATTVDDHTLELLCTSKREDIILSNNSPLGVKFNYLRGTTSDIEKQHRIEKNKPGSPCPEKHLTFNTEFTQEPICTASQKYQKLKIDQLKAQNLPETDYQKQLTDILDKECLCVGLSNAASIRYHVPFVKKLHAVNICPGPNVAYFTKVISLQTMIDHIYGRTNVLENEEQRPNMFITELELYVNHFQEQVEAEEGKPLDPKRQKYIDEYYQNMINGINYYRNMTQIANNDRKAFEVALDNAERRMNEIRMIEAVS